MTSPYDTAFYVGQSGGSVRSADILTPMILDRFPATSVLDVGCGVGGWLAAFKGHGVARVLGVDGDWVDVAQLRIAPDEFRRADLTKDHDFGRFDLAISLEVAEHLPEAAAAKFVQLLTQSAPVIVFSAAAPQQGGTDHINEQWPRYWARLFAAAGYQAYDVLRPRIWRDPSVEFWYRQNMLVFCAPEAAPDGVTPTPPDDLLEIVHPDGADVRVDKAMRRAENPKSFAEAAAMMGRGARGALRFAVRGARRWVRRLRSA